MNAYLLGVQYHLPEKVRANDDLVALNPGWDAEKIYKKTGIRQRRITENGQTASDLGYQAARRLLDELDVDPSAVDAILFCTQSPDYFLPTSACLLQERLGLQTRCAALDFNLGCSGFTYGLWLARGLIRSGSARNVLLVVAETYSKYCDPSDLSTVSIFGDGGGAALISAQPDRAIATLGESIVGTNGRGAENLIVRSGCARTPAQSQANQDKLAPPRLYMNGPEIFSFTLSAVQEGIQQLLDMTGQSWAEIDWFLLHQANRFMLEHLRDRMEIPVDRMPIDLEDTGNTVSASLPILLRKCQDRGLFQDGQKCVLAGFGVGYSWAMTSLTWGAV